MDEKVALVPCANYNKDKVDNALAKALDCFGGLEKFVQPGQRVLLKVNLLTKRPPEDAVTTHPAVVKAVVQEVMRVGGQPLIYDSPGGPFTEASLQGIYDISGLAQVATETGAKLNLDVAASSVPAAEKARVRNFTLSQAIATADVIINLPKLKSHGLTRYTGAVKNLFGCIPGLQKAEYHLQLPVLEQFADFLLDLALTVKPVLTIMDAVVAMEGEGPSAGTPRHLGYILVSPSVFALDAVAVNMIGLKETEVPTTRLARERCLLTSMVDDMVMGASLREVAISDFVVPPPGGTSFRLLGHRLSPKLLKLAGRWLGARPVFQAEKCRRCGICVRSCPAKALTLNKKQPTVDLTKCIRCFCCQELCPAQAVIIHRPWLSRWLIKH
ncbi:MAG: DUF362 domain-containing protein [Firmicutes bacterium]|nr:DUF362 domain-containing protein [Bacillota bacterium]